MNSPLITIGIPSYNQPAGLTKAIDSILSQSYNNFEILIADDCSPDNKVLRVLEFYSSQDSRISYVVHERNMGPRFNFNFLLRNARGKYFMWLADDDYRHPECLELLIGAIGNYGSAFSDFGLVVNRTKEVKQRSVAAFGVEAKGRSGVNKFLMNPTPNIMYALHDTERLRSICPSALFDFWDFYVSIKMIDLYGCAFISEKTLIMLGIDEKYKLKPYNRKLFRVYPVLNKMSYLLSKYKSVYIFRRLVSFFVWSLYLNYLLIFRDGRLK